VIAFLPSLGFSETLLLLVVGLLLFGRNLPDVGRSLGRTFAQLRRGLDEFKSQIDHDGSLREIKNTMRDTTNELKRAATLPRKLTDPAAALRDLTNEALASPPDDAQPPPDQRAD
jgi:sec-independent protein translocase protein TatA